MPFTIAGDWIPEDSQKEKQLPKRPVKIRKEKRRQSWVTVILNLRGSAEELKELTKDLKKKCACGGTLKNGLIEIQGDKVDLIKEFLLKKGIKSQ